MNTLVTLHTNPNALLADAARRFTGTTEIGGDNRGPAVERFQKAVDGVASGEPWCMCFVQFVLKEVEEILGIRSALPRSESCLDVWDRAPIGMKTDRPFPGGLAIWRRVGQGERAGHTGIVVAGPHGGGLFTTVEGNVKPQAPLRSALDGVFELQRQMGSTKSLELLGFLRAF